MKTVLFSIFLVLRLINCSNLSIAPEFKVSKNSPAMSRCAGIVTSAKNSYINALLAAAYSIPRVQEAFYEEGLKIVNGYSGDPHNLLNESLTVAIATKFAMIRLNEIPMPIGDSFFQAIQNELEFDCREKSLNIFTFFKILLSTRPESINNLFNVNIAEKSIEFETGKVVTQQNLFKSILLPNSSTLFSISTFLNNILNPIESTPNGKDSVPKLQREISNTPDVMLFRIDRVSLDVYGKNVVKNNGSIFVDREIILNNNRYILVANVEYDEISETYSTVVFDFGDFNYYRYEANGQVTKAKISKLPDTKSVLLFYVPKSVKDELNYVDYRTCKNIPQSFITLACNELIGKKRGHGAVNNIEAPKPKIINSSVSNSSLSTTINPEIDVLLKWNFIYKPDYNLYDSRYQNSFQLAEYSINSKISIWPVELLDILSKFSYGTFELGSQEYSFKKG